MRNFCNLFGLEQCISALPWHQEPGQKLKGQPGKGWPGEALWVFGQANQENAAW